MKILEGLKTSPTTMSSTSTSSSTVSVGIVLGFRAIIDICGKLALDAFWKLVSETFPAAAVVVEVDKLDVIDVSDVVVLFLMVEDGEETVTWLIEDVTTSDEEVDTTNDVTGDKDSVVTAPTCDILLPKFKEGFKVSTFFVSSGLEFGEDVDDSTS